MLAGDGKPLGLSFSELQLLQLVEEEIASKSGTGDMELDASDTSGDEANDHSDFISQCKTFASDSAKTLEGKGVASDRNVDEMPLSDDDVVRGPAASSGVELSGDDLELGTSVELSESDANGEMDMRLVEGRWNPGCDFATWYNRHRPLDEQSQVALVNVYLVMRRLPRHVLRSMLEHIGHVGTFCWSLALRAASAVLRLPGTSIYKVFSLVRNRNWRPLERAASCSLAKPGVMDDETINDAARAMETLVRLALSVRSSGMPYSQFPLWVARFAREGVKTVGDKYLGFEDK